MTTVCPVTGHGVVVVGAGPAGLSAATRLQGAGMSVLVIDRSDSVGSAWRTRYDSFRLHTIRWLSGLPEHVDSDGVRALGRARRLRCLPRTLCPPVRTSGPGSASSCKA